MRVEESITIGELSRRTGVNIETIRYFERVGVLATPPRTSGGRRVYGTGHVRALGSSVARANSASPRPRCARSCLLAVLRRRHAVRSARSRLTI
jgi:MerR family mercuric resistance operon transcriptional regulator